MWRSLLLAIAGVLVAASVAWASCVTHYIVSNGQIVVCTTCCAGSSCTTTCF